MTTEIRSDALSYWPIKPWVQLAVRGNSAQLLQFHIFVQCSRSFFGLCFSQAQHLLEAKSRTCNHVSSGWIGTYGIHHWRSFRSSYIELTFVVVEPTATKFRLDALTNWTLRPLVQLTHTSNFVQLLQFHLFVHCSRFILVFPFVRHHICFKPSLALRIRLVAE